MDQKTINRLNQINRDFYHTTAEHFDQTRGRAWMGWQPLPQHLQTPLTVLDVGCGNGRFGTFLANALNGQITYHGVDNNAALLQFARQTLAQQPTIQAHLAQRDIIEGNLEDDLPPGLFDLVVLFGVIHHVPGAQNRLDFVRALAQRVAPGGMLCMASWRFYEYERFRERLVAWDDDIATEPHDYLLDWRSGERALRYCHYVDDAEQARLEAATGLQIVTKYRADGSDGKMNQYVLLRRA